MRQILAIVIGLSVSACGGLYGHDEFANYTERKDTITMGAGDAVKANMVAHTLDGGMWPRGVGDRRIPMDGARATRAVECYHEGSKKGSPGSVSNTTASSSGSTTTSQTTTQTGNIGANGC